MQILKKTIKKVMGIDAFTNLQPLNNLIHLGSKSHGYHVPQHFLNNASICYCIGAGEDVSFDTELVINFGCKVFIFDPMPESKNFFNKLKEHASRNQKLVVGNPGSAYEYQITEEQLATITYIEKGIWDKEMMVKFYEPTRENYASHSILNLQQSDKFIEAPVDRLSNIMKKLNHKSIDLVKIEIEGAEYTVIDTIVEDKIDVKFILVEFDEVFHSQGMAYLKRIKASTDKILNAGYTIAHSTHLYKRLFVRNDVYKTLKSRES